MSSQVKSFTEFRVICRALWGNRVSHQPYTTGLYQGKPLCVLTRSIGLILVNNQFIENIHKI